MINTAALDQAVRQQRELVTHCGLTPTNIWDAIAGPYRPVILAEYRRIIAQEAACRSRSKS